jgi:hypothetical protein
MLLERAVAALESIAASLSALTDTSIVAASAGEPATPPKPRGRPRKDAQAPVTEAEFTSAPVTVVVAKPDPAPAPVTVVPDQAFPYEQLKAVVIELANSGAEGKAAAINVMGKFGVRKASDAPAEKWKEMHDAMKAVLDELNGGGEDFA